GSEGAVTVTGAGSVWTMIWRFEIGSRGNGSLTISNGGQVNNSRGIVGMYAGSVGRAQVTGSGSTWHTDYLDIGSYETSEGTLVIDDGALVSANEQGVTLALRPGSVGTLSLKGDSRARG